MEPARAALAFVKELGDFSYELSTLDRAWDILFPDKRKKWHHLHVVNCKNTYYITHVDGDAGGLEVGPKKGVRPMDCRRASSCSTESHGQLAAAWEPLIASARKWLEVVRKDWVNANKQIRVEYPLRYKYGVVPNALIRASLPDAFRLDKELGLSNTRKLVRLEDLFDVMHYDDLGRFKRRIAPFVTWEPLPLIKPRTAG